MKKFILPLASLAVLISTGLLLRPCEKATVSIAQGYGASPALPKPNPGVIPTVNIAPP